MIEMEMEDHLVGGESERHVRSQTNRRKVIKSPNRIE